MKETSFYFYNFFDCSNSKAISFQSSQSSSSKLKRRSLLAANVHVSPPAQTCSNPRGKQPYLGRKSARADLNFHLHAISERPHRRIQKL
jgi:hypothetical protein